jgi:hypothetical protein
MPEQPLLEFRETITNAGAAELAAYMNARCDPACRRDPSANVE